MTSTLDILTLEEARTAIGASLSQSYDDALELMVTAVSSRVDDLCGPVVNRTVTERHEAYGCYALIPRSLPVSSFTSVTEYVGGTGTVLTAETDTAAGTYLWEQNLVRRRQSFRPAWFKGRVKLVYVSGRAADTDAVPERFKQAAKIIVAHMWRQEMGSGNQTFGADGEIRVASFSIPNRAMELLADDVRVPGIA